MRTTLALTMLALWASDSAAAVPAADGLWLKGDYRAAFAEAIEPAIKGDARAQFLIGEAYRLGRSVNPDNAQAESWYARAARQGDVTAATELGLVLIGEHRESAAVPWLTMAAQRGEPRALCSLAALYFNGDGVRRDEAMAYALMVRAFRTGLPEARARLATLVSFLSNDSVNRGEALLAMPIADVALPPVAPASAMPAPVTMASVITAPVASPPQPVLSRSAARQSPPPHSPVIRVAAKVSQPVRANALRVQVGAFRSAAAAERAWTVLAARIDGLDRADHMVVKAGLFFRLQAGRPAGLPPRCSAAS